MEEWTYLFPWPCPSPLPWAGCVPQLEGTGLSRQYSTLSLLTLQVADDPVLVLVSGHSTLLCGVFIPCNLLNCVDITHFECGMVCQDLTKFILIIYLLFLYLVIYF